MSDVKKKNPLFELFMQLVMVIVIYTVRVYLLVWYRPKVTFLGETVKSPRLKTPSVIIANHTSMWDPLMMLKCVIPCDRFNMDTEWALLAKRELEKGNNVIIFPEGKCRYDGLLNEFKTGFAFLARSTGAPVLSVGIDGIYKRGHRTQIVISEPEKIERVKGIPSSKHLAERSEYFRQKVWGLKQQALGKTEVAPLPIAAETPEEVEA